MSVFSIFYLKLSYFRNVEITMTAIHTYTHTCRYLHIQISNSQSLSLAQHFAFAGFTMEFSISYNMRISLFVKYMYKSIWDFANILCDHTQNRRQGVREKIEGFYVLLQNWKKKYYQHRKIHFFIYSCMHRVFIYFHS